VGRKFTVFALFYFVFEDNFQVQALWGAYIRRGDLTEGFLRYEFGRLYLEGLIVGILRYVILHREKRVCKIGKGGNPVFDSVAFIMLLVESNSYYCPF